MKNKKTLYLLVPLVVGLWGLIGYRVWDAVKPEEEEIDPISIVPLAASQADSVALYVPDLQYPDPFLKGVRFVSNRRSAAPIAAPASQPAPAATPQP
ncbi:MAG TPA: hypothetical protein DCE41_02965, partial [Cytophagales bacterium]|nr:hypothetical protein [Cytophagales bacterium]